jgi:cell division protein FtsB
MARQTFLITALTCNLLFIIILIHKKHVFTEASNIKAFQENELIQLTQQEEKLQQQLCMLQDQRTIKKYAQSQLRMVPLASSSVRKLSV